MANPKTSTPNVSCSSPSSSTPSSLYVSHDASVSFVFLVAMSVKTCSTRPPLIRGYVPPLDHSLKNFISLYRIYGISIISSTSLSHSSLALTSSFSGKTSFPYCCSKLCKKVFIFGVIVLLDLECVIKCVTNIHNSPSMYRNSKIVHMHSVSQKSLGRVKMFC